MNGTEKASASVLIAHPEIQHSHQMAAGLSASGLLGLYLHGAALPRYMEADVPEHLRRRVHWFQPLRRSASRFLPARHPLVEFVHQALREEYDRHVARLLTKFSCRAVVAYELSALRTFKAAKKLGIACILDAASVHFTMQLRADPTSNSPSIIATKELEIASADLIVTCSTLARDSYIAVGVPSEKIASVPLGTDVSIFEPPTGAPESDSTRNGKIVFCNAGHLSRRKGLDLLVSACHTLHIKGLRHDVIIAGNKSDGDLDLVRELGGFARLQPRVPHTELPHFYAQADVFVLPSRFDSFGMVVSEALACGLPVIVSDMVGAKDLVQEGVNGWVIPAGDASALAERMAWCAENPIAVRAMAPAARASAIAHDWHAYRRDIAALIGRFLEDWPSGRAN